MRAIAWPLDALRAIALRAFGRFGRTLLRDRDLRVSSLATLGVLFALALAVSFPAVAFALGPLVLGVPHLVADVRYLVVRPGHLKRFPLVLFVLVPLVFVWLSPWAKVGLLPVVGAIFVARSTLTKKSLALGFFCAAYAAAWVYPTATTYVILHAHNVVAVALYAWLFARSRRNGRLILFLFALGCMMLLSGATDALLFRPGAWVTFQTGASLSDMAYQLAPLKNVQWALRIAAFFVFAQSVHYVVWLRLIPDDARERRGVRTFASSFRALAADIGAPLLWFALALSCGLLVFGAVHLDRARLLYLSIASFHGYLEFAIATIVLLEGRGLKERLKLT